MAQASQTQNKNSRLNLLKSSSAFSKSQFLTFITVFAVIGAYFLWHSFAAAPSIATLEAEQMSLPAGASIIQDSSASGGRAVHFSSAGTAGGNVYLPAAATGITLVAKGSACTGSSTQASLIIDNTPITAVSINGTSWKSYSFSKNLISGLHSLQLKVSFSSGRFIFSCYRSSLDADVLIFNGSAPTPTPSPTISLSALPATVSSGQAATLTWISTNTNSCTASGAWAGSKSTSGSASTGALNSNSTYYLSCTGSGGSASASATVTVSNVATPPPAPPPPTPTPTPPPPSPPVSTSNCTPGSGWGTNRTDFAAQVLTLINQHRASLGLSQLTTSPTLTASATWKSLHMAEYNYFSHDDPAPPVARAWSTRITDCGYKGNGYGENIAYGFATPADVVAGWLNSPGHKANIENSSYHVSGIGVASDSSGQLYWTQDFGYTADSNSSASPTAGTPTPAGQGVN